MHVFGTQCTLALAGPSTWNSLPKRLLLDPSCSTSGLAVFSKHSSSQNTNVCSALEALARMPYINRHFTLQYITLQLCDSVIVDISHETSSNSIRSRIILLSLFVIHQ